MNKKIKIIITTVLAILLGTGFVLYNSYTEPKRVIKNYITSLSNHNYDEVSKCRTLKYSQLEKGSLDYIDSVKLIELTQLTDDTSINEAYLHRIEAIPEYQHLPKDDFKLFKVSYYLKVNDDQTTPIDSGEFSKSYVLIKENNKWKIDSIEEC